MESNPASAIFLSNFHDDAYKDFKNVSVLNYFLQVKVAWASCILFRVKLIMLNSKVCLSELVMCLCQEFKLAFMISSGIHF